MNELDFAKSYSAGNWGDMKSAKAGEKVFTSLFRPWVEQKEEVKMTDDDKEMEKKSFKLYREHGALFMKEYKKNENTPKHVPDNKGHNKPGDYRFKGWE